jgi:hypothetical protein
MYDKVGAIGYVSRLFPILPIRVIKVDENGEAFGKGLAVTQLALARKGLGSSPAGGAVSFTSYLPM